MKILNVFKSLLIGLGVAVVVSQGAFAAEVYNVDPAHTSATFKVKHLAVSYVRGSFSDVSGTLLLDRENPEKSSVEFVVKTASVDTNNNKRDDHLRTADFFDVENYPEMTFKSTKIKPLEDDVFEVTGDFTLHGVTKSITVEVEKIGEIEDNKGKKHLGFSTEFKINSSDYKMKEHLSVGNEVKVMLETELILKDD